LCEREWLISQTKNQKKYHTPFANLLRLTDAEGFDEIVKN